MLCLFFECSHPKLCVVFIWLHMRNIQGMTLWTPWLLSLGGTARWFTIVSCTRYTWDSCTMWMVDVFYVWWIWNFLVPCLFLYALMMSLSGKKTSLWEWTKNILAQVVVPLHDSQASQDEKAPRFPASWPRWPSASGSGWQLMLSRPLIWGFVDFIILYFPRSIELLVWW